MIGSPLIGSPLIGSPLIGEADRLRPLIGQAVDRQAVDRQPIHGQAVDRETVHRRAGEAEREETLVADRGERAVRCRPGGLRVTPGQKLRLDRLGLRSGSKPIDRRVTECERSDRHLTERAVCDQEVPEREVANRRGLRVEREHLLQGNRLQRLPGERGSGQYGCPATGYLEPVDRQPVDGQAVDREPVDRQAVEREPVDRQAR